ncbi:MAG: hypothetical protein K0Q55_3506 [Verrucomicrobia bacterium]|jgi:hypothetical protein|nr:hypothetical protein [Verrucomicrobiota bacterium]
MKHLYPLLALSALIVGCSTEETDLVIAPAQTAAVPVVDVSAVTPSLGTPSAFDPLVTPAHTPPSASAPLVNDAEKKAELADLTEKVYLKWNAALDDYRKKHNRLPRTLPELQQFHPVLASLQPPHGFALTLDPQAGEIFIVHARTPSAQPVNSLPPPLAIP